MEYIKSFSNIFRKEEKKNKRREERTRHLSSRRSRKHSTHVGVALVNQCLELNLVMVYDVDRFNIN